VGVGLSTSGGVVGWRGGIIDRVWWRSCRGSVWGEEQHWVVLGSGDGSGVLGRGWQCWLNQRRLLEIALLNSDTVVDVRYQH